MAKNALEVNNLSSHVGDFALRDISLKLERGSIMGLVGKNGAGKTTFVKTILNMIPRTGGEVLFDGLPLHGNEEIVKAKIGVVFESPIYPAHLKAIKIKNMMAPFYQSFDHHKFEALLKRFELDPNKKISTYSKGMQMKFSIAMALSHSPDIVIFDEPTAGLDPVARADFLDLLLELMQNENMAILFSTHITSDLEKIADYLTIIDEGRIILSQSKNEIIDKYALVLIDKEMMNDELKADIIGLKETAFGYSGLCVRDKLAHVKGVKMTHPTIEDLLIFLQEEGS